MENQHLFLNVPGKYTTKDDCLIYLQGNTERSIISATSWDCEKTLIYGFNHHEYERNQRVISYGSCTVNAYVPLANFLQKHMEIIDSDVNVIHNIQEYRLAENNTPSQEILYFRKIWPPFIRFFK